MFYKNIICDQKSFEGKSLCYKLLSKRFESCPDWSAIDLMILPFALISKITET